MSATVLVSFPEEFLAEVDQVAQDELSRLAPGTGEDSTAEICYWRDTRR